MKITDNGWRRRGAGFSPDRGATANRVIFNGVAGQTLDPIFLTSILSHCAMSHRSFIFLVISTVYWGIPIV